MSSKKQQLISWPQTWGRDFNIVNYAEAVGKANPINHEQHIIMKDIHLLHRQKLCYWYIYANMYLVDNWG